MNFDSVSSKKKQLSPSLAGESNEGGTSVYIDPFSSAKKPNKPKAATVANPLKNITDKRGPLSVEEVLRLRNQKAEPAQPKFYTKAERARLALERKQKEADAMRNRRAQQVAAALGDHPEEGEAEEEGRISHDFDRRLHVRSPKRHNRDRSRSPTDHRSRLKPGLSRFRYYDRDSPSKSSSVSATKSDRRKEEFTYIGKQSTDGTGDRVLTDKERYAIKQRYLVGNTATASAPPSRPQRGRQGGRKMVADWDASEDTSRDINDLYENRQELHVFGRRQGQNMDDRRGLLKDAVGKDRMERIEARRNERTHRAQWDERHWTEKPLAEMRDRDWRIFKEDYSIASKGGSVPHPYRSWEESSIPGPILQAIQDIGYREPTPIQRQAIPIGLQGRDLVGIAETGSGKTASFLIPMLAFIMAQPMLDDRNANEGPYALIMAPTRELAQQIEAETQKFSRRLGYRSVSIVGGHDIGQQEYALRNGAEIIIATPGRLRDCIDRRVLVLNQCTYVVMDEADRMMDMGFEEDVNFILDALPSPHSSRNLPSRLTTMFSATMPPSVERLTRKYLNRPATVIIGTAGKAVDTVEQRTEFIVGDEKRKQRLMSLLSQHGNRPPIIVFVNQKKNADLLGQALARTSYSVVVLHGGKSQDQREAALAKLKNGNADILVATDVAGRGIDVKNVSLVVNFDMAKDIEGYTHRIGRTGRAGNRGLAVTFLSGADDRDVLYDLRKMIAASPVSRCPPELANHEAAQAPPSLFKAAAAARK